jgi:GNAT superfamily N-acetyltransferase
MSSIDLTLAPVVCDVDTSRPTHSIERKSMQLAISVLADRMDLLGALFAMETSWPEFMLHDPFGDIYYGAAERFAEHIMVAEDPTGAVVAKAFSMPFKSDDDSLFDDGWDGVIKRGMQTYLAGEQPNRISAIEVSIRPDLQGGGLSHRMLAALRDNARRNGFEELIAPVRPHGKSDPLEPMSSYAARTRDDGLPTDPWLRVHVRAGGTIASIASRSMVITGTVKDWRARTGLPFDQTGRIKVPGALAPVHCDLQQDMVVYVEPNVWVRHRCTPPASVDAA